MEGRIVWSQDEVRKSQATAVQPEIPWTNATGEAEIFGTTTEGVSLANRIPQTSHKPKVKILLSVDFDAVSGWLGTGQHPDNNLADYSTGFFSGHVGVPRLLKLFAKHGIASKVTWFVPMHSAESFPKEFAAIKSSGAEIGLHGYCHEGAPQLTPMQEREVLEHCISLYQELLGKRPLGCKCQCTNFMRDILTSYTPF
jgi:hypothetical protein